MSTSEALWLHSARLAYGTLARLPELEVCGTRRHGAKVSRHKIIKTVIRCSQGSFPSFRRRNLSLLPLLWLTRECTASEPAMDRFHLKNKYFVLRHGRSIPNENGLIVASMVAERCEHGCMSKLSLCLFSTALTEREFLYANQEHGALQEYGLAPTGILQAEDAGKTFLKVWKLNAGLELSDPSLPVSQLVLRAPFLCGYSQKLQEENVSINKVRIYSSPFSRTRQTAELVVRVLDPESRFLHIQVLDAILP